MALTNSIPISTIRNFQIAITYDLLLQKEDVLHNQPARRASHAFVPLHGMGQTENHTQMKVWK